MLVCRELPQQVLIGVDFLTAHKCIINVDTNTVYSKGDLACENALCLGKGWKRREETNIWDRYSAL